MTQRHVRTQLALAGLLTFILLAVAAVPAATAAHPWRAKSAEDIAIRLTNCIRTGGHVTRAGTCRGWGSGRYSSVQPKLIRSDKISTRVTWPWAKRSVQFQGTSRCWIGHSKNGSTVDRRFASANLKASVANGENMGCGLYGSGEQSVIRIVRMWQDERKWRGPHWRQIKDKGFKSAGIGVARFGARKTQLVLNFYGKTVQ